MLKLVYGLAIRRSPFPVNRASLTSIDWLKSACALQVTRSESGDNFQGRNSSEENCEESMSNNDKGDCVVLQNENGTPAKAEGGGKSARRNRNRKGKKNSNKKSDAGAIPNSLLTNNPRRGNHLSNSIPLDEYMRNDYVTPDANVDTNSQKEGGHPKTPQKGKSAKRDKGGLQGNGGYSKTPERGDHVRSDRNSRTPRQRNDSHSRTPDRGAYSQRNVDSPHRNDALARTPHSNQRNKLPEIRYEPYISHEKCSEGLKRGDLIKGALRINVKSYKDAFIDSVPGERDINIDGMEMRNRALPGDIVAVEILPKEQWKKAPEVEGVENRSDSYRARTGKVVYIIEKKHSRVAAGHLNPYKNHAFGFALMSPVDNRLPRLMIPLNECPVEFKARPKDFEKTLFVARISNWGLNMAFATGQLMRSLGEAGHIEPETESIIMSNNIDSSEFQQEVLDCLPDGDTWRITKEELSKRKDLRKECIFTIDPATARDLDDALSCKKISDDLYEVGVHIADVSHFIEQGNALDKVAHSRATSVYLAQKVIPMLPRVLCEQLCSLNPGVDRLAYSVIWNMKSDGTVVKEWFGRSVICSATKLSYDHAQEMIENPDEIVADHYPPVHGNFSLQKIAGIVNDLYGISVHLRKGRFDSGALRIDMPKLAFALDSDSGLPNGCRVYEYKDSNKLIEEFMLMANMAVGRRIYKAFPKEAILRLHPPPHEMMMEDLANLCEQFDIPFDTRDSASINRSLHAVVEANPEMEEYLYPALTLMCAKPFQNAKYFCTGSIEDESMYRHYALNVPIYTHFTSPIRRFPDVMVHRLLTGSLDRNFKFDGTVQELQATADHCNDKKWAAKKASEQSSLLFFAVYVKECGPLTEKGVVVGILDKAIDVLSTRLGTVNRVYCDQLSLRNFEFTLDKLKPRMSLHWQDDSIKSNASLDERLAALTKQFEKKWERKSESEDKSCGENEEETGDDVIVQELTIFSPVDLVLTVKDKAPTKIVATIVNPFEKNENPEHGL